jgi:DNA-binding transcriptional regulator YhcF (GntR family)
VTAPALPGDDDVRAAADELLTQHRAGGTYPSVSALAKGFGINRTTFYRHYAEITSAMLDSAEDQHTAAAKRRAPRHNDAARDKTIRRLRAENIDLRRHLEIYEEHIRRLTIENSRYKDQLEGLAGVADLSSRRNP